MATSDYGVFFRLLVFEDIDWVFFIWIRWFEWFEYVVHRTVAMDIRGYGDSDRPKGQSNYTIEKVCDDIKAVIEHLSMLDFAQSTFVPKFPNWFFHLFRQIASNVFWCAMTGAPSSVGHSSIISVRWCKNTFWWAHHRHPCGLNRWGSRRISSGNRGTFSSSKCRICQRSKLPEMTIEFSSKWMTPSSATILRRKIWRHTNIRSAKEVHTYCTVKNALYPTIDI